MVTRNFIGPSASNQSTFSSPSPAGDLGSAQRRYLSLKVLGGTEPVTHLAARHGVSRKFVYQLKDITPGHGGPLSGPILFLSAVCRNANER